MSASNRWITAMLLTLLSWASVRAQDAEEVIRVDTALVTVNVSVADAKGRRLSGLQAEDFRLTDEGQRMQLEFFDGQGPASIVFVVDISSSMQGEKWKRLKAGLKKFLAKARVDNDYTLIAFSDTPQLIVCSVNAAELWQNFSELKPSGNTALYDAALLGLNTLERVPQRHKALVLLSDGVDTTSRAGLSRVQQEALAHRATIYTVGILYGFMEGVRKGQELLNQLADATGGLVQFPALDEIREVLETINDDVGSQYSLSYYPPHKAPGWRQIQVSLAPETRHLNLRYQRRYLIR
ncbi:MAG: VWA domain-containing protein [Acidobacteriota bacterium]|nr:VWA domain-containing protein [Acidobacteriota bacterium]